MRKSDSKVAFNTQVTIAPVLLKII